MHQAMSIIECWLGEVDDVMWWGVGWGSASLVPSSVESQKASFQGLELGLIQKSHQANTPAKKGSSI